MSIGTQKLSSFLKAFSTLAQALLVELDAKSQADFVAAVPATIAAALDPQIASLTGDQLQTLKSCFAALVPDAAEDISKAESFAEHLEVIIKSFVPEPTPVPTPVPTPDPVPTPAPVTP